MTSKTEWFDINEVVKTKIEVEDEVLAAVEEGQGIKEIEYTFDDEGKLDSVKEVVKTDRSTKVEPKQTCAPDFIRSLRNCDRYFNRTCACCLRRHPLEDFYREKRDEFCIECRESVN